MVKSNAMAEMVNSNQFVHGLSTVRVPPSAAEAVISLRNTQLSPN